MITYANYFLFGFLGALGLFVLQVIVKALFGMGIFS